MGENGSQFRTAALGGFHKQDVLEYITRTAKDHLEQMETLKKSQEAAQAERDELAQRVQSAEAAQKKSAAECQRLSETLTERTTALECAERELAQLKEAYEKASIRLAELEEKTPDLEAGAAAYAALKDSMATIELEAHRKARETEERAQAQAAKVRSELEAWVHKVHSGYQLLKSDVMATVTHVAGEMERGQAALIDSVGVFDQYDQALEALLECNQCGAAPKPPMSLSVHEAIEETDGNG